MKAFAALTLALALFSSALANPPQAAKKPIRCAVQGEKLDVAVAMKHKMYTDYKGRRYFFCCDGCPQEFKKNPEKYAKKADSIPTPKPAKK